MCTVVRRTLTLLIAGSTALALPAAGQRIGGSAHALSAAGAGDGERAREIARVVGRLAGVDSFAGVVLVAKHRADGSDSVLYLGAFGQADRARGIPLRPDTRFPLASITKTFISVAVAQLVEAGTLSWDDSLGRFLPTFPLVDAREQVRIRHLLTHTSGLWAVAHPRGHLEHPAVIPVWRSGVA